MNSKKTGSQPGSKPDDLIRSNTIELNEEELGSVSGGIKGESSDAKHKDEVHVESLKLPR